MHAHTALRQTYEGFEIEVGIADDLRGLVAHVTSRTEVEEARRHGLEPPTLVFRGATADELIAAAKTAVDDVVARARRAQERLNRPGFSVGRYRQRMLPSREAREAEDEVEAEIAERRRWLEREGSSVTTFNLIWEMLRDRGVLEDRFARVKTAVRGFRVRCVDVRQEAREEVATVEKAVKRDAPRGTNA